MSVYGFLVRDIDDKLADTVAPGKTVVVPGLNGVSPILTGALVTISTGALVETTCTAALVDV